MKVTQKNVRQEIPAGIHLVTITEVKAAKINGRQIADKEQNPAVDFIFKDAEGKRSVFRYFKSQKNRWMLEQLLKAIQLDPLAATKGKDFLRKQLYIVVANEYWFENGYPVTDFYGKPLFYPVMTNKFFPYNESNPQCPVLDGDPAHNSGYCSGIFRKEKNTIVEKPGMGIQIGNSTVTDNFYATKK